MKQTINLDASHGTMTLSVMTFSIKGLFVTLGINDTYNKQYSALQRSAIMLSVIMMSLTLYLS
jgi:hypothetical protein